MSKYQVEANKKWRQSRKTVWNAMKRRNYKLGRTNTENSHDRWSIADCEAITNPARPSDRVLAARIGRSVAAIQVMRSKLRAADDTDSLAKPPRSGAPSSSPKETP